MAKRTLRVLFYAPAVLEYANRVAAGVCWYQTNHPDDVVIRDFRYLPSDHERPCEPKDRVWNSWRADGIVSMVGRHHDMPAEMATCGRPVVNACTNCWDLLPTVRVSPDSLAQLADRYFSRLGFRHFAFVGLAGAPSMTERCEVYCRRLRGRGVEPLVYELRNDPIMGLGQVEELAAAEPGLIELLVSAPKPLALLAGSDQIGRAVCNACRAAGVSVPSAVSVLGIDNLILGRTCDPPLSSIHSPGEEVGGRAMETLVEMMAGATPPRKPVEIPATRLIPRQSTTGRPTGGGGDVERALQLIRDRACGATIEQILDELGVSRRTLERQFKAAAVGRSPGEELQRVRLERGVELLRTTDLPIARIAEVLGYAKPGNFTDAFTEHFGVPPSRYRARRADAQA